MGLDQFIFKERKCENSNEYSEKEEIMYWRKCNQIHCFFDSLRNGVDNCEYFEIYINDLKLLVSECKEVLNNNELAERILPTQAGFFFGSTEYDEWYFDELKDTVDKIEKIIEEHIDGNKYYYYAWW